MFTSSFRKSALLSLVLGSAFSVRLRYAPSPTGMMHIGGIRTALFNYLLARKMKGKLIVRIEDTDKSREVAGSIENIFDNLAWVGIQEDQSLKRGGPYAPYVQSQRLPLYKQVEKDLLRSGKAYPCFCGDSKAEVEGEYKPYDGKCRHLSLEVLKQKLSNKQAFTVRIKGDLLALPPTFEDLIYGPMEFKPVEDFIIVRSNGWPTFHLANVIDDHQMGITHVLRGEEWLSSTNKHIYLYVLLGKQPPQFAHLPMIRDMTGKKLSKRDPNSSMQVLRHKHYEVDAVASFIGQLGLKRTEDAPKQAEKETTPPAALPKNQKGKGKKEGKKNTGKKEENDLKLQSQAEMVGQFDLSKISRSPVRFDIKQLDFLNRQSLGRKWKLALTDPTHFSYFLTKTHQLLPASTAYPSDYIKSVLTNVASRLTHITDLANYAYFYQEPDYSQPKSREDFEQIYGRGAKLEQLNGELQALGCDPSLLIKNAKIVHNLRMMVEHVIAPSDFSQPELAKRISEFLFQSPDCCNEEVFHLLRYVLTARKTGPSITQAAVTLGRQPVLARLARFSHL